MLLNIGKLEFVVILLKCITVIINGLAQIVLLFTVNVANELEVSHIYRKYFTFT